MLETLAREALDAHDQLVAVREYEPPSKSDGMPLHPDEWLRWHETMNKPAYDRWDNAMSALAQALGEPTMSRHPFNFRPRCEAILAEDQS